MSFTRIASVHLPQQKMIVDAEKLNEKLKLFENLSQRQIVWIQPGETIGTLNGWQRLCIWICDLFGYRISALHYFIDLSQARQSLTELGQRTIQYAPLKPELAKRYWNCWKLFQINFCDMRATPSWQAPAVASTHLAPVAQPVLTPPVALLENPSDFVEDVAGVVASIGPVEAVVAISSPSSVGKSSANSIFSASVTPQAVSLGGVQEAFEIPSLAHTALEMIQGGLLSQALWLISKHGIATYSLGNITQKVADWIDLNLTFKPTLTTPLDLMALNKHESSVGQGWGYKSANLTLLQAHCNNLNQLCKHCKVSVPSFLPTGDLEMQSYIQRAYPELMADWAGFLATFSQEEKAQFLGKTAQMKLNVAGRDILSKMRQRIEAVFETQPPYTTPQLQAWLKQQNPHFVIVRSTGKEDSATNSNAGGNASLPFIKAEAQEISLAIGKVLASYFGEKSILQRLSAYDGTLITEAPFMPVLIQEMVGENVGGVGSTPDDIPRSGVMFTSSHGKARGVTELCVGLGNNEGVVTSSVSVDRYLIDENGGVAKVVQPKETRYVAVKKPGGKFACEAIDNQDEALKCTPAIADWVARDMKVIADYFSQLYGSKDKPMPLDMEFTIKLGTDGQPIIYLLQARPLVPPAQVQEPCYLEMSSLMALSTKEQVVGKTLIAGGAYVRAISSESQIIVCPTIQEAFHKFLDHPDQANVKSVIIQKKAPTTSHEAVMFQCNGVGVLVVGSPGEFDRVQAFMDQLELGRKMFLDLQRGVVLLPEDGAPSIQGGYVCYPIPLEYSMSCSPLVALLYRLKQVKLHDEQYQQTLILAKNGMKLLGESLERLKLKCNPYGKPLLNTTHASGNTLRTLLEKLAGESDPFEARLIAGTILESVKQFVFSKKVCAASVPDIDLERLMVLENLIAIFDKQLLPALSKQPPYSLERLYPIRLIEACLFQTGEDVFGGVSLLSAQVSSRNINKGIAQLTAIMGPIADYEEVMGKMPIIRVSACTLEKANANIWLEVAKHLDKLSGDNRLKVMGLISEFDQVKSLPDWVNAKLVALFKKYKFSQPQQVSESGSLLLLADIASGYDEAKSQLQECKKMRAQLATIRSQLAAWGTPDHIAKQYTQLRLLFESMGFKSGAGDLSSRYAVCSPMAKLAWLGTIMEAVRTYDEVIKTCTGSEQYTSPKEKATHFKLLLEEYAVMMKAIVAMANSRGLFKFISGDHAGMSIDNYLKRLDSGATYDFGWHNPVKCKTPGFFNLNPQGVSEGECEKLLLPGADFSVAAVTLGTKASSDCSILWPESIEDYFTTFHQNMEICLAALRGQEGFSKDILPGSLRVYCEMIMKKASVGGASSLSGIFIEGTEIQAVMSIPLRQHAAKVTITYDMREPLRFKTKMEMFGNAEHARWELTAACASLIGSDMPKLKMEKPVLEYKDVNFWKGTHVGSKGKSAPGTIIEFEVNDLSSLEMEALGIYIQKINSYSVMRGVSQGYLGEVFKLRHALGATPTTPVALQNMLSGGYIIAPDLIAHLVGSGQKTVAMQIFQIVEQLRQKHGHWMDKVIMHNETHYFSEVWTALAFKHGLTA